MSLMVKRLRKDKPEGEEEQFSDDAQDPSETPVAEEDKDKPAQPSDGLFDENGVYQEEYTEEELLPLDAQGCPMVEVEPVSAEGAELVPISKPWDETENWITQPVLPASKFRKDTFRSKKVSGVTGEGLKFTVTSAMKSGVYMTLAKYKADKRPENVGADSMVLQGFSWSKKAGWTVSKAKAWLKRQVDLGRVKAQTKGEVAKRLYVQILKTNDEEQLITGIALAANRVDLQTDFITPEEIRKTMITFMEQYQQFGLQHEEDTDEVKLVESYQAPVPFVLKGLSDVDPSDEPAEMAFYEIQKGDWVITVHVLAVELWKAVKEGRYTGFSIEGLAHRTPIDIDELPEDVEVPEEVNV